MIEMCVCHRGPQKLESPGLGAGAGNMKLLATEIK